MKQTFFGLRSAHCMKPGQAPKAKLFSCIPHPKRVNLVALLLLTASLLLVDVRVETRYAAAQSQPDCGSTEGVKLPCWDKWLGSGEGDESLPLYPYAKRPNGCSIPGARPGSNDSVNIAGINISFTDICNKHDQCYYTRSTTASECNDPFQSQLRARCEREIADHEFNGWDLATLGMSRAAAFATCEAKAIAVATAVIGTQGIYHKEAHDVQEKYEEKVAKYVEETKCSPLGPMSIVYVDTASTKTCERGNEQTPYHTITQGTTSVVSGGTVFMRAGVYAETLYIDRPMTLVATSGIVTIDGTNAGVASASVSSPDSLMPIDTQASPSTATGQPTDSVATMTVYLPLITNLAVTQAPAVAETDALVELNGQTEQEDAANQATPAVAAQDMPSTAVPAMVSVGQVIYLPLVSRQ